MPFFDTAHISIKMKGEFFGVCDRLIIARGEDRPQIHVKRLCSRRLRKRTKFDVPLRLDMNRVFPAEGRSHTPECVVSTIWGGSGSLRRGANASRCPLRRLLLRGHWFPPTRRRLESSDRRKQKSENPPDNPPISGCCSAFSGIDSKHYLLSSAKNINQT